MSVMSDFDGLDITNNSAFPYVFNIIYVFDIVEIIYFGKDLGLGNDSIQTYHILIPSPQRSLIPILSLLQYFEILLVVVVVGGGCDS